MLAVIAGVAEVTRRTLTSQPAAGPSALTASRISPLLGALHFATAAVALFVPLAAGLYLAVTVTWTLAQRLILRRRYPLDPGSAPPRG
jgi:YidC/Oxa1 family membrane protein insertase